MSNKKQKEQLKMKAPKLQNSLLHVKYFRETKAPNKNTFYQNINIINIY